MASASSLASIQAPPVALRASALARARAAARARGPIVPRAAASASPMSGIGACHAGAFLSETEKAHLVTIAAMIGTPGKGITACDEGPGTIGDRFEAVGVVNTEENRRAYRQVLFESEGANEFLSAAILDPETLYQKSSTNGELFPKVLMARGIVPGVKPHLKIFALPGQNGATVMQGLDSLAVRCAEYKAAGCEFAKVRPCAFPKILDDCLMPCMECSYASFTNTISAPEYKTVCSLYKSPITRLGTDALFYAR